MSAPKPVNLWKYKPWWCQPWSIFLTGLTLIAGSWIVFKTVWLTVIISIPILVWMGFFLLLWPALIVRGGDLEKFYPLMPNQTTEEDK